MTGGVGVDVGVAGTSAIYMHGLLGCGGTEHEVAVFVCSNQNSQQHITNTGSLML